MRLCHVHVRLLIILAVLESGSHPRCVWKIRD